MPTQIKIIEMVTVKLKALIKMLVVCSCVLVLVILGFSLISGCAPASQDAPEAEKIMSVQGGLPFQILIPAYLPAEFDRAGVDIKVDEKGPGNEPMVQLTYHTSTGALLFIREWLPVNPTLEILSASRPVETKWGKGWLLVQGEGLVALWVDVGPLRASVYTTFQGNFKKENVLQIAETLGPASNRQVFSFVVDSPEIKEMAPPAPIEISSNANGVQELTLVITPGGYNPLRFAVKKGIPVRLIFRQLGQVGCGNELMFPSDSNNRVSLTLKNPQDQVVYEFTPTQNGQFQFFCSHQMYRGVMTVHD